MDHLIHFAGSAPPWFMIGTQLILTSGAVRLSQLILDQNKAVPRFIEEFICVFQTIVLSYELGVVRRAYGIVSYSIALFLAILLYGKLFRKHVYGNPTATVHKYVAQKRMSDVELFEHFGVQVAAAWVAYQYVHWLWASALAEPVHKEQLGVFSPCKSFIKVSTTTFNHSIDSW